MQMLPKNNSRTSVFYDNITCFSNISLYVSLYLDISEFLNNFKKRNWPVELIKTLKKIIKIKQ